MSLKHWLSCFTAAIVAVTVSGIRPQDVVSQRVAEEERPVMKIGDFEVVPTFCSCGFYFGSEKHDAVIPFFRKAGATVWTEVIAAAYFPTQNAYRGSIPYLEEDTEYELQLRDKSGKVLREAKFRTWSSQVKIAKTVVLNSSNFKKSIKITDKGKPDGWIKYTAAPGFVLTNDKSKSLMVLDRAEYVILENIVFNGGDRHALELKNCNSVRVVNCEFTNWGRVGTQNFTQRGMFIDRKKKTINFDGAIDIRRGQKIVVERCYAHDAAGFTNSWRYAHPAGTEAIVAHSPRETVIRYNDFIGSDEHRFNDAVESDGNFRWDGGLHRDADVYGNYMVFCNDDCIELDGGQCNMRCFLNRFEAALCGISIQGCMTSPVYLYNNIVMNMEERFAQAGQSIKTGGGAHGLDAQAFVFNNTIVGRGTGYALMNRLHSSLYNNILAGDAKVNKRHKHKKVSHFGYNFIKNDDDNENGATDLSGEVKFVDESGANFTPRADDIVVGKGCEIPGFTGKAPINIGAVQFNDERTADLPYRPIPVKLDKGLITFEFKNGSVFPNEFKIVATVGGKNFSAPFTVRQNRDFDWFEVTPKSGVLKSGSTITFTVRPILKNLGKRSAYRGAFLVRLADGYSRPVSVFVRDRQIANPAKPQMDKGFTEFIDPAKPINRHGFITTKKLDDAPWGGVKLTGKCEDILQYSFKVPKTGYYYLLVRSHRDKKEKPCRMNVAFDDGEPKKIDVAGLQFRPLWICVSDNAWVTRVVPIKLTAGKHTISIDPCDHGVLDLEGIVITDNPLPFEPL